MPEIGGSTLEHPALVLVFEIGPGVPNGIGLRERIELDKVARPSRAYIDRRLMGGVVIELRGTGAPDSGPGTVLYRQQVCSQLVYDDSSSGDDAVTLDAVLLEVCIPQRDEAVWIQLWADAEAVTPPMAALLGLSDASTLQPIGQWSYAEDVS